MLLQQIILALFLSTFAAHAQIEVSTQAVSSFSSKFYGVMIELTYKINSLTTAFKLFLFFKQFVDLDWSANIAVSPYSVINTFVTLAQASNGETLRQIRQNIRIAGAKADLVKTFVNYKDLVQKSAKSVTLLAANKIYVHESYQINERLREIITHQLESGVETVNFLDATETAGIISDFVVEKTQNKIKDFLNATSNVFNHTPPRIVPINAVYIRIAWKTVYESIYTKTDEFRNHLKPVLVDFMHFYYRHKFNYTKLPDLDASALEIKLVDSDFTLLLILSDHHDGFGDLRSKMRYYDLTKIIDQMHEEFVEVVVPKFKIEYQAGLKDAMKNVCGDFELKVIFDQINELFYSFHRWE